MSSTRALVHKCKGYRREEITLTPDAFRNTVVVYREPSLNERCVLCGRVVTMDERPFPLTISDVRIILSNVVVKYRNASGQVVPLTMNLDTCIGAANGKFQWGGTRGVSSAKNITLVNGSVLSGNLMHNGQMKLAQINLATNIEVRNGRLVYISDEPAHFQAREPSPPPSPPNTLPPLSDSRAPSPPNTPPPLSNSLL
ncbi:hypothetical protein BDP27DRAFT_303566 [Rhodocollybia butyracea]|uniref:Cyanovirin-N domain-containing protein n=1 Tax=Rhodocollybia butyracea TaxID=206335 RepID=A0A9P5PEY1_9AGAR|nr:hypothetical protein BDP27DRAFT_303566 [Rhodocollybia butyracea]